ncbi:MAG: hypothetical protein MZV65_15285 [Chromatiales bacterium]|nr:hypothetical protein [Chromatiales bacterium]
MAADDDDEAGLPGRRGGTNWQRWACAAGRICGRRQVRRGAARCTGYSLMLDGLSAAGALRMLEAGLGRAPPLGLRRLRAAQVGGRPSAPDPSTTQPNKETATMGYIVNGTELETDEQGYLLEPDYSDEAVRVIAAAEGIDTHRRRTGRSSTTCATSTASTATRRTSATCSRAWRRSCPAATARRCTTCFRWARPSRVPRWPACRNHWARADIEFPGTRREHHAPHAGDAHQEPLVQAGAAKSAGRSGQRDGLHRLARGAEHAQAHARRAVRHRRRRALLRLHARGAGVPDRGDRPHRPRAAWTPRRGSNSRRRWCATWRARCRRTRTTCWARRRPARPAMPTRFIDLVNEVTQHYAEFGADPRRRRRRRLPPRLRLRALPRQPPGADAARRRTAAGCIDQVMATEAPEAVGIVQRSMRDLLRPTPRARAARHDERRMRRMDDRPALTPRLEHASPVRPGRRRRLPALARLASWPQRPAQRRRPGGGRGRPARADRRRARRRCCDRIQRANMALYRSPVTAADKDLPRALGRAARPACGSTPTGWPTRTASRSIAVSRPAADGRGGFIPYTDRADPAGTPTATTTPQARRIRGMILHCVRPAAERRRQRACSTTSWPTSRCATPRPRCVRALMAARRDDHSRARRRRRRGARRRSPARCSRSTRRRRAAHALHRAHAQHRVEGRRRHARRGGLRWKRCWPATRRDRAAPAAGSRHGPGRPTTCCTTAAPSSTTRRGRGCCTGRVIWIASMGCQRWPPMG